MRPKLVFITGAPGIGKTEAARRLFERLENSAWLDGDDVWRMNPFRVDDTTIALAHSNIESVLRNYLAAGFSYVIFSWVLHQQAIIDRILKGLEGLEYELSVFTLVSDEGTLLSRLGESASQGKRELALLRLRQSKQLQTTKIDTSHRQPNDIVDEIVKMVERRAR